MLLLSGAYKQLNPEGWQIERKMFSLHDGITAAVIENDRVLAAGTTDPLIPSMEWRARIAELAVLPDYRGIGLGRRVVAYLEEKASEAGMNRMDVCSLPEATGFYGRLGYEQFKPSSLYFTKLL